MKNFRSSTFLIWKFTFNIRIIIPNWTKIRMKTNERNVVRVKKSFCFRQSLNCNLLEHIQLKFIRTHIKCTERTVFRKKKIPEKIWHYDISRHLQINIFLILYKIWEPIIKCLLFYIWSLKSRRETNKKDFKIFRGATHAVATTWQSWGQNFKSTNFKIQIFKF